MRGHQNEAWVTGVISESNLENVLVLNQSLKRVLTSRKLVVLVAPQVSLESRKILRKAFDYVFSLDDDEIKSVAGHATAEEFSLLFTFALQAFEKCVWLGPNMFAVRNCDEIFNLWEQSVDSGIVNGVVTTSLSRISQHFTCLPNGDVDLCLLKPSVKMFNRIVESLQFNRDGQGFGEFLKNWFINQTPEDKLLGYIDEKYRHKVSCNQEESISGVRDHQNLFFVQLDKNIANLVDNGTTNLLLQHWKNIYVESVKPLIRDQEPLLLPISDKYKTEPIAVVGMSCRYPKSNSVEEFWNLLFTGSDATSNPPEFRWLSEQCIRNAAEFKNTNAGFLSVPVDEFDSKFFGISNKEAVYMDPQIRILHELVWESLEDAGMDPHSLRGVHGGVFIGSWVTDYRDILQHSGNNEFYRSYMGTSIGAMAARMSFMLGMTGPSIATESGCSSAMVAVHLACKSLLAGESNLALACGVNLLLHPFDKDEIPMALASDGRCKTFSTKADGFGRAEGCAVLVLKRLSDAVKDGDRVWGLLRGSAMTQEGISKSMGTPTVHCEALAMTQALRDAGVKPEEVSYVEAHGTGTVVGDPLEVSAIAKAYHSNNRKEPLMIGSVKTNVGHTEACSGITGLMKVILALHHDVIPPHINFDSLNPSINLEAVPAIIPLTPVEWKRVPGETRYAGVSAFGIAGTDVHVIVEETPEEILSSLKFRKHLAITEDCLERPLHLVRMSAKSEEALEITLEKYKNHFKASPDEESLANLAFTANTGRAHFSHRAVVVATSKEEFIQNIEQLRVTKGEACTTENLGKVCCFLFTGQGSQYPGMAKNLYDTSPVFRVHFDHCETILRKIYKIYIKHALWGDTNGQDTLSRTIYSQTSIFCVEYALMKLWESWGVTPDYVLGHSLGEFCAAVCCGILSLEDALKLVAERSQLIDQLPGGKMLVVKLDHQGVLSKMKEFLNGDPTKILDIAAINSEEQTVVAGDSLTVEDFCQFLTDSQVKCLTLDASHAFHSRHMDDMLAPYLQIAQSVTKPDKGQHSSCGYISSLRGTLVNDAVLNPEYWVEHTREKVKFLEASKKALELGCKFFIEIGPQPVLTALTMLNAPVGASLTYVPSLKKKENGWTTMLHSLAKLYVSGADVDWKGFDQCYPRKKLRLPHYPFIRKKFWPDVNATTGVKIHPLLGSPIANASGVQLFAVGMNISNLEWVKDHAIGENVIFPAAAFLEMCLVAGVGSTQGCVNTFTKPCRPVKVENLVIEAPLCLLEGGSSVQVQTVVEMDTREDSVNHLVKISHRMSSDTTGNKWLRHANATFCPLPTPQEQTLENYSLDHIILDQLKPHSSEVSANDLYNKLSSIGLNFGPVFRSVEKLWKMKDALIVKVKAPMGDVHLSEYVLHPVISDAMLQGIMMFLIVMESDQNKLRKKLYVPIKVGKFVWISVPLEQNYNNIYVRVHSDVRGEDNSSLACSAVLMDSTGKALAIMSGVEVIDTTVKAVESVIKQQQCAMPDLWEESWKRRLGLLEHRLDLARFQGNNEYSKEMISKLEGVSDNPSPILEQIYQSLMEFSGLSMLRALYDCGWQPKIGKRFQTNDLFKQLGIQEEHRLYFGFILDVLEEEGILQRLESDGGELSDGDSRKTNSSWEVILVKYTLDQLLKHLQSSIYVEKLTKQFKSAQLLVKVGESFGEILRGKQNALSILFPEEKTNTPSVGAFYEEYGKLFGFEELGGAGLTQRMQHFKDTMASERFILRILEIGAGTGAFTNLMLQVLENLGVEYEYTYTDISAGFFPAAEKKFEKYVKNMKFKKLNVEEDPLSQGFIPEYFDYACASEVVHATRDINESLSNVRQLLRSEGKFDLIETTVVNRYITFLVGLLPGYWRFQDLELRPKHCTMPKGKWKYAFGKAGYEVDHIFSCLMDQNSMICVRKKADTNFLASLPSDVGNSKKKVWITFLPTEDTIITTYLAEKLRSMNRHLITVCLAKGEKNAGECDSIYKINTDFEEDFKWLLKRVSSGGNVVEGVLYCLAIDRGITDQNQLLQPLFYLTKNMPVLLESALQKTLPRVIVLTEGVVPLEDNDLSHYHASTLWGYCKSLRNEMTEFNCRCIDITDGDTQGQVRWNEIFGEMFNVEKEPHAAYNGRTKYIPKFQPYKPSLAEQDLTLPQGTDRFQLIHPETRAIQDLQFGPLDHFHLGDNEIEVQVKCFGLNFRDVLNVLKPTEQFKEKDFDTVGFDFAGKVMRIGMRVTKWAVGDMVFGVNFDGSALPSHIKIQEDYVIAVPDHLPLIQAATLPVVFSTAYHCLVEVAQLKPTDVVLIHTASGGVGLSAIDICRYFGVTNIICTAGSVRKRNFLKNLGIQHIFHSRNTSYAEDILRVTNGRGVDVVLNSLTSEGFKEATLRACTKGAWFLEMSKIAIWSKDEMKKLRPDINYYLIDVDISTVTPKDWHLRLKSLRRHFLDKRAPSPLPMVMFDAVSIRQALIYLQKARQIGKVVCLMPDWVTHEGQRTPEISMFNPRSSYMITGGLGGIGFLICQWMIRKGSRNLILVGRSPPSDKVHREISKLKTDHPDLRICVVRCDVGDKTQCNELFSVTLPSMSLPLLRGIMHCAGTLSDGFITNQDWGKMSQVFKAKIHGTVNLHEHTKSQNLEHFVLFSSIAALFGPPGQANHSAANCFEDAFAHYRHSIGLPATTINWGQWGEVGVATEQDFPGIRPISNLQGLTALEHAMKTHRTQTCALNVDSFVLWSKMMPQLGVYLDERVWKISTGGGGLYIKSEVFWQEYDSKTAFDEKVIVVKDYTRRILTMVLRLEEGDNLRDDVDLQQVGLDSLVWVEIKNAIISLLGDRMTLNTNALRECNTINRISEALVRQIEGEDVIDLEPLTSQQVDKLIRQDCILAEDIRAKEDLPTAVPISQIKTVLLTGATGTLGVYLLRELVQLEQITQIICLLRSKRDHASLKDRLLKVLDSRGLSVDLTKVEVIPGNCSHPHLGLDDATWRDLSSKVDAVFNCFANVNHLEQYRVRAPHVEDVRTVNIGGTKNILQFACETRVKHVFHTASIVSVATTNKQDGSIWEGWPESGDYDGVTSFAYPISKYVEDMLMKEAVCHRQIPCKVFRLPYICGDSKTGQFSVQHNHLMLRYIFIMKQGIMPSNPFPLLMLPADLCVEIMVKLAFNEEVPCDVYNITHNRPDIDQEFPALAEKFGFKVNIVEFSEFAQRVLKSGENIKEERDGQGEATLSGYHPILQELYRNEDNLLTHYNTAPAFRHWLVGENREEFFVSKKIQKYMPQFYEGLETSLQIVERDLAYARSQGWF